MLKKCCAVAVIAGVTSIFAPVVFAQGKGETIKIQDYAGTGNMLARVAIAKGYCEKYGIKCQLQVIASGPLGAQALMARSIDVAFMPAEVQINAMIKGANLKLALGGAVANPFLLAVPAGFAGPNADKGYPAFMADLKGLKIGVPARGSAAELQFLLLASHAGMKSEDFSFVAVGSPNTAFGALASKQIDANFSFEPHGAMCAVLTTCKVVFWADRSPEPKAIALGNGGAAGMVVTQEFLNTNAHVVDALIAAANDAEAFMRDPANFDEVVKIAETYFKFEMPKGTEILATALKTHAQTYKTAINRASLKAIADNMLAMKQIDAPFDTPRMIYDKAP